MSRFIQRIGKPGVVRCAAPTGVAAANLDDAYTVHSLFAMPWDDNGGKPSSVGTTRMHEAKLNLGPDVQFIIIDEFSMLSDTQFSMIDRRLRDWTENDVPFGGLGIIMMGDPFPIPPVMGKSLIKAATETENKSGILFNQFKVFTFGIQQRSIDDKAHSDRLMLFRQPHDAANPVNESNILHSLQVLQQSDAEEDPGWRNAVIAVSGNEQRVQINLDRAVAFAADTKQPVIAWRLPLKSTCIPYLTTVAESLHISLGEMLQNEDELKFYFVKGAPVMITDNISVAYRIANGTRGCLHSLTLSPSISDAEWLKISRCHPGEIHWLPDGELPITVNISFPTIAFERWNPQWTILDGSVVIPLSLCTDSAAELAKTGTLKKSLGSIRTYSIDLAFSVTFHKIQGQTEDKIILDFNPVGKHGRIVDLATFYVGVSRVRRSKDIRILPMKPETIRKLKKLKFSKHIISWYKSAFIKGVHS